MYKFIDTTIQRCRHHEQLPTSAMNYNGVFLEELIDGYRTLSVDGREMLNIDLQTDSKMIGSHVYSYKLPPRIITVKYKLVNRDPQALLLEYRKLINFLFSTEDVALWFNDELDVIYQGRYYASSEVPGETTSIVSSFQIYCQNPIKRTTKTFTTNDFIGIETPIKTYPSTIKVNLDTNTPLIISNGVESIRLFQDVAKRDDVLLFDFEKGQIFINGKERTNVLELSSDFENFELRQGAKVTTNNGTVEVTFRGCSL